MISLERRRRAALLAAACAAILAAPAVAAAADTAAVQVWAIRATKRNSDISPELKDMADALKKDFKYTGYKLEKKAGGSVEVGKSLKKELIGDYLVTVEPSEKSADKVTLKLTVLEKQKDKTEKRRFSTTLKLTKGKAQLVGRWDLDNGDVLILAVSAK